MLKEVFRLKKDYITKKAIDIYLKQDHSSISINALCKEINISKKTFYKYFISKNELLLEVDQRILKDIFIPEFTNIENTANNFELFTLLIRKFVNMGFTQPDYFNFFYFNFNSIKTLLTKPIFKHFKEFRSEYSNIFSNIYDAGLSDGSIKPVKAFSCMNILRTLNGLLLYMITDIDLNNQIKEDLYKEITSYVDHFLGVIRNN